MLTTEYIVLVVAICVLNVKEVRLKTNIGTGTLLPVHNITNILMKYVAVCGPKICDQTKVAFSFLTSYQKSSICSECSCDRDTCWGNGDCCPDIYLQEPHRPCFDNTILDKNDKVKEQHFRMVDVCPNGETICDDTNSHIFHLNLVTSNRTKTIYRCYDVALCNNESSEDLYRWEFNKECKSFADFNYLSTESSIIQLATDRHCDLYFPPPLEFTRKGLECNKHHDSYVITKCNVTGNWHDGDPDVEFLCEYNVGGSVYNGIYSNVFCYMCNPERNTLRNNKSDKCSNNSKRNNDPILLHVSEACAHFPEVEVAAPFKNFFCYLCNFNWNTTGLYTDANASVSIEPIFRGDQNQEHFEYLTTIKDIKFDAHMMEQYLQNKHLTDFSQSRHIQKIIDNKGVIVRDGKHINITELMMQYYTTVGSYDFCFSNLLNVTQVKTGDTCSCNLSCLFDGSDSCCLDLVLLYKSCSTVTTTEQERWIVAHGCHSSSDVISGSSFDTDFLVNDLPLEDDRYQVTYSNLRSALCHTGTGNDISALTYFRMHVTSYDIFIKCSLPLHVQSYITLEDVIKQSKKMNCSLYFQPKKVRKLCDFRNPANVPEINSHTCTSVFKDPSLNWACSDSRLDLLKPYTVFITYKNVFCRVCGMRSLLPSHFLQDTCVPTSDIDIQKACTELPATYTVLPYKNVFCRMCNQSDAQGGSFSPPLTPLMSTNLVFKHPTRSGEGNEMNFRHFFTLLSFDDDDEDPNLDPGCKTGEFYDKRQDICRQIVCYPGKLLTSNECKPLFTTTRNLTYNVLLRLEAKMSHDVISHEETADVLLESLLNDVGHLTDNDAYFMSAYILFDSSCHNPRPYQNKTTTTILFDGTFHVTSYVNRLNVEKKLINANSSTVFHRGNPLQFNVRYDATAHNIHKIYKSTLTETHCYISRKHPSETDVKSSESYHVSVVNDMLLCKQAIISNNEFTIDDLTLELTLIHSGKTLDFDRYLRIGHNKVHICLRDLPDSDEETTKQDTQGRSLAIFTIVLLSVSILSLVPPLVTYCIFPSLRSIPGLNTMGLIGSLIVLQSLMVLQFSLSLGGVDSNALCTFMAIVLHISWLSYFTWSLIGTVHLYRVFISINLCSDDTGRLKQFIMSVVTAIAAPSAVVVLYLILVLAITSGSDVGYGTSGGMCFISTTVGKVLTFIVPVIAVSCFNIFAIVVVFRKLASALDNQILQSNKKNASYARLYVKIISLSGITWLLQVIDGFFPLSAFSFIVTFINASQGVMIFISCVCNKETMNLYKNINNRPLMRPRQRYSTVRKYARNSTASLASSVKAVSAVAASTVSYAMSESGESCTDISDMSRSTRSVSFDIGSDCESMADLRDLTSESTS